MKFHLLPVLLAALTFSASASAADFEPAATATNQFGLDLFRSIVAASPKDNVLISPYSIQSALAMTYAGADGTTRTEMARVLHFPADDVPLAASFGAVRDALNATVKSSETLAVDRAQFGRLTDTIEWHTVNRLFGQVGFEFRDPFLTSLKDRYGAPLAQVDFKTAWEPTRVKINEWVASQTKDRIQALIPERGLSKDTRLVLVNALYLKAPWADKFEENLTQTRPFQLPGGAAIHVSTMAGTRHVGYAKGADYTAVAIGYLGGDLQFVILLPDDPKGVDVLAGELSPGLLKGCAKLPLDDEVGLFLPRIRVQPQTRPLDDLLQGLGMKTAFDIPLQSANFERMAAPLPDEYLYLAHVFHQTFLSLDELGTEAAAATAAVVEMRLTGAGGGPEHVVHVDHPFLFAIQHRASGVCLFLGKVTDPR